MVRNITLSADETLIERARERAKARRTTLNAAFREWLADFAAGRQAQEGYDALMERLAGVQAGRTFTREERLER
jgi:predicted transcriptional regulator